ncbi:MAG: dihydrolipoamide acetyltransferase family protein [Candidatus Krumholzibacteria bacterium]|jgi:pyruvate dehydrogenase E2 component (dihydrolipoamide acetyltransferase)|nr:dihydrolipoamide acetyltransferase family protein [Candidatus Krumholzibacteria bacterium]MDP6669362.1 dihydrolipoamide acetyltransferase family protein [Candidatus Krumholzibacteria bacterium]MDP6796733.1 dihydrolipoamide acetyltransferase family protein [Candidatus Krumholzibacteria bacterium]MDP7022366.1 dihydrolipoamide acetyltransferase family protein [Candidatus Krumholzibacteria bacterium]
MYEFKLPDLGEGIHEGELLEWHVHEGDSIQEDDPLLDVETDKAAVTIPSPATGTVLSLQGNRGDTLSTGSIIAVIDDGKGKDSKATPAKKEAKPKEAKAPAGSSTSRVAAAPAVRRLAREKGIDLGKVAGSGPGGRILVSDLEVGKSIHELPEVKNDFSGGSSIPFFEVEELPDFSEWGEVEIEPLRSIRRKIARRLSSSMIIAPHVAHMDEADVSELAKFLEKEKERGNPSSLTFLSFVLKAAANALADFPEINASLDPHREALIYKKYRNLGFATDTGRGLVVPVIRDTGNLSVQEISAELKRLSTRAREGSIEVGELRGGTFSVTNIGVLGGTGMVPTINYPEAAILGMAAVREKPVVREGEIVARKVMPLTLAFDHRITDGANAARFMNRIIEQLESPLRIFLED